MRDVIARALIWVLRLLLPARGRHSAAPVYTPEPESAPVNPWSRPWPTPFPDHIRALYAPLRGEDVTLSRPYVLAETTVELSAIRERRRAAELATLGVDYPYSYPGAPFPASAFAAAGAVA